MKIAAFVSALLVGGFLVAPAVAAPGAPASGMADNRSVVQVQYRYDRGRYVRVPSPRHYHYVPGRRYAAPPRGWHRYKSRPRDWNRRGCVIVGPVWFCP